MVNVNYGVALEAAKEGKRIARQGWNGKGMFVFQRAADELTIDFMVHTVKSLPQSVKDYFARQTDPEKEDRLNGDDKIKFLPYLCMKAADNSIVNGWLASQTDMLSNDWVILD